MCTLTWIADEQECRIFFNRDEKRTRLPARPPEIMTLDGTRVLTPADGNAGGSWLTVNEHGLAVAVLNFYEAAARMPGDGIRYKSRGRLVLNLSSCPSLKIMEDRLSEIQPAEYRPFFLVVFNARGKAELVQWDGSNLVQEALSPRHRPLTTSSFKTREVLEARKAKFEEHRKKYAGVTPGMLRAFQQSRDERGGAYSVTMTREDAQTVSYSEVEIRDENVKFFYQPREMGTNDPPYLKGDTYTLKRA